MNHCKICLSTSHILFSQNPLHPSLSLFLSLTPSCQHAAVSMTTPQASSERWEVVSGNFCCCFIASFFLSLSVSLCLVSVRQQLCVTASLEPGGFLSLPQIRENNAVKRRGSASQRLCGPSPIKRCWGGGCVSGRVSVNVK